MPAPFIDAQDLTDHLGRDVTGDNGALIALDAACDICRTVAEQSFNAGTATISLDGTGSDVLVLPERPSGTATAVTVGGSAETDFMVTEHGLLLRGSAGIWPRPVWPAGRQNIQVTYEYGYAPIDLPRDVRVVALSIAERLLVQGVAKREAQGDASIDYATAATDLTAGELRILRKYRGTRSF